MRPAAILVAPIVSVLLIFTGGQSAAQSADRFAARLTWVPISLAEQRLVGGHGVATATLTRSRLAISGAFDGLPATATAVRLHHGKTTGVSGPAIAELELGNRGEFAGSIDLSRAQRDALFAGALYIQVYSEPGVPPDNSVLRGWLLADQR